MVALIIWVTAVLLYLVFWAWYVGFKGKLSPSEVENYIENFSDRGASEQQLKNLRYFLESDDGKEWFMVNAMTLKHPEAKSFKLLDLYVRAFMSGLVKRAGHPIFISRALADNVENHNCEEADHWTIAAIIRYRSRRDGAYIMLDTLGSEHHDFKLKALEKTFAFPSKAVNTFVSPRVIVALLITLMAAFSHLAFVE